MDKVKITESVQPPKTRIELHTHLDGSMRYSTVSELLKQKKLKLPGNGSVEDLRKEVIVTEPLDLGRFLSGFSYFLSAVQDDFQALERIAYEFCEDKANQSVLYVEARYSPHAFLSCKNPDTASLGEVITAVQKGFSRGEQDFHIKVRGILCSLVGTNTAGEVLELFQQHKSKGLVGLDLAAQFNNTINVDEVPATANEVQVFQEAKKLGIHRTIHAGERGSAEMVRRAVEIYGAERIGHGYHVLEDKYVFKSCLSKNIHFECCPTSSFLTGAVPLNVKVHPIMVMAQENANFSISTDDSTVTGFSLSEEYSLLEKWGLNEAVLIRCNMNALKSCFLPASEKKALLKQFKANLGIP